MAEHDCKVKCHDYKERLLARYVMITKKGYLLGMGLRPIKSRPPMHDSRDNIIPGMACLDWVAILPVWILT